MARSVPSKSTKRTLAKSRAPKARRTTYRHGHLRDALVEEALRLMVGRADASFTLRKIAQRIGVSHSAAYRHFPNKGALLAEIARQGFEKLAEALSEALESGATPEEVIRLQGRAYVRTALEFPAHFRCMFGPRQFSEEEGREVDEAGERAFACVVEAARRYLGIDHEAAAQDAATLAMWSTVHGLAHLALDQQLCDLAREETIPSYEALADDVVGQLLRGLSA